MWYCFYILLIAVYASLAIAEAVPGDVRLLDSDEDGMGAVEYYDSFIGWTGICADSFYASQWLDNIVAAMVVCRQLGYEDGISLLYKYVTSEVHCIPHLTSKRPTQSPHAVYLLINWPSVTLVPWHVISAHTSHLMLAPRLEWTVMTAQS